MLLHEPQALGLVISLRWEGTHRTRNTATDLFMRAWIVQRPGGSAGTTCDATTSYRWLYALMYFYERRNKK